MKIFFSTQIEDGYIRLSESESKHCFKVLRLKSGNNVFVTDGRGHLYTCKIEDEHLPLHIIDTYQAPAARPYYLHLAVAPVKNQDRIEWMVEKAVETGVDEISFVQTSRTEKGKLNMSRLENKTISAMKQSLHYTLPIIHPMMSLDKFLQNTPSGLCLIAHCMQGEKTHISYLPDTDRYTILIGPEGDFSTEEVEKCISSGFLPLSLGTSRLRTETAALATCMGLYLTKPL